MVVEAGERGREADTPSPLMYTWHGKHYLGAAHGLAGIATVLLQVTDCTCTCTCTLYSEHVPLYIHVHVYMYTHVHVYMYTCIHMYMYVFMYTVHE